MNKKTILLIVLPVVFATGLALSFNRTEYIADEPVIELDTRDDAQKVADNGAELSRLLKAQNEHTRALRQQLLDAKQTVIDVEDMITASIEQAEELQEKINDVAWQLQTLGI